MRFLPLLSLLLLASPAAFALPSPDSLNEFKNSARELPNRMNANGYRQLGDLNADDILRKLPTVDATMVDKLDRSPDLEGYAAIRNSAIWHRTKNKKGESVKEIQVNGPWWRKTEQRFKSMLSFHEHLGVLGFKDTAYACSGSIWALTNRDARQTLSREELAGLERIANNECQFAGGSTGITGGGDYLGVKLKVTSVEEGLAKVHAAKSRAERELAVGDIYSCFYMDVFAIRGFKYVPPRVSYKLGSFIILQHKADIRTIEVWVNERPIPQDAKNGWTYDIKTNPLVIFLHGRAIPKEVMGQTTRTRFEIIN